MIDVIEIRSGCGLPRLVLDWNFGIAATMLELEIAISVSHSSISNR